MEVMHSCLCCLQCPPDKDLTSPYTHHDKIEIYSDMLKECFNIQMVLDGWDCGICSTCMDRLRDASHFKQQVQRCQEELRAREQAKGLIKACVLPKVVVRMSPYGAAKMDRVSNNRPFKPSPLSYVKTRRQF